MYIITRIKKKRQERKKKMEKKRKKNKKKNKGMFFLNINMYLFSVGSHSFKNFRRGGRCYKTPVLVETERLPETDSYLYHFSVI